MMDTESDVTGVKICLMEDTIEKQYEKCQEELQELGAAIDAYVAHENSKNRAEIAFEGIDVITAVATLLRMKFTRDEIKNAVDYTNAKNYVRGYRR